jgi:hypothetical protein
VIIEFVRFSRLIPVSNAFMHLLCKTAEMRVMMRLVAIPACIRRPSATYIMKRRSCMFMRLFDAANFRLPTAQAASNAA